MERKVEVVKQVRLTPAQRMGLMAAAGNGGICTASFDVRQTLRWLGLIEERPRYSGADRKKVERAIAVAWKALRGVVARQDSERADRILRDIRHDVSSLKDKAWFVTAAANEYLTVGKVTVVAGRSARA